MRPDRNSRRLFGITRSKGKMYELGLPENFHIAIPPNTEPNELLSLTLGTLGDVAASVNQLENLNESLPEFTMEELNFSASFFDALLQAKFAENISEEILLLAASAYYLAFRPGSSHVLAKELDEPDGKLFPIDRLLRWVLNSDWRGYPADVHPVFEGHLSEAARLLATHFHDGSGQTELLAQLNELRRRAYDLGTAWELLLIDLIGAIIRRKLVASSWLTLPRFTGVEIDQWASAIRKAHFPKELWPSQILLGEAGLYSGSSGVIQMPTSAGKTRSVEIILRSGFLSGRAKLAVVVAPFRALCHEIGTSLRSAFRDDGVKVNELSDALQMDFLDELSELFRTAFGGDGLGINLPQSQYILVLTPEKLLFILRQSHSLANDIGIVIYNEGHQFDSGGRGITYELLLTEIKTLLPENAQTILISAVIQNAAAIGTWLIGDSCKVVNGSGLLPTTRSVAYASWMERMGQLMFFESETYTQPDYFVPRVIEAQELTKFKRERKTRRFPSKDSSGDVALYVGIRLVSQGAVAIFCGRKATASSLAVRAVEIYQRDFNLPSPALSSNDDEIGRMSNLIATHFGNDSDLAKAALLGIFVHHGTTPHGIRLSIEYGMQQGLINFVICTSTLAQGVNLPIRYLVVTGVQQGTERIKVRDFQNLIGRAGRSGMHTEGLVIFSDPGIYDQKNNRTERWKFNSSVELLSPSRSEDTTSSLLDILAPLQSTDGATLPLTPRDLCNLILSDEAQWLGWAEQIVAINPQYQFRAQGLVAELRYRRQLMFALESYLMANRGNTLFEEFKSSSEQLAMSTLAYYLAPEDLKPAVITLFATVTEHIQREAPVPEAQAFYSRTLLGVNGAKTVESWVNENRDELFALNTSAAWLHKIWPLLAQQSDDKFFHSVEPDQLPIQLASSWLLGQTYSEIISQAMNVEGTRAWGDNRRRLTGIDIVEFCESILGFQCSLIVAAVSQFLFGENFVKDLRAGPLLLFQKSLKYGLPDQLSISAYELGFADRVVAQTLAAVVRNNGFTEPHFAPALNAQTDQIRLTLQQFPSYYESVLESLVNRDE
ncbi:DEAD/DEAH box helicase [Methylovorus sp. SPW-M1]